MINLKTTQKKLLGYVLASFIFFFFAPMQASLAIELDRTLKPNTNDEMANLFENVVAVQRKAKVKTGKWLFYPYLSIDFSDSAYTQHSLALNFGKTFGEYWEVYFSYVPTFFVNERNISKKVRGLTVVGPSGNQAADISNEKAVSALGVEVNWVPIYGKDSWGPYGIIRSDTFFSFGISQVTFERNSGMKYKLMAGKTFFLDTYWNLRVQAGICSEDSFSQNTRETVNLGLMEGGLVYYF